MLDVLDGPKFNLFEQMVSFKPNRYIFIPGVSFVAVVRYICMCCLFRPCICEHASLYLYNTTYLSVVRRSFASGGAGVISSRHNGTCIFNSL